MPLTNGRATLNFMSAAQGTHTLTAIYNSSNSTLYAANFSQPHLLSVGDPLPALAFAVPNHTYGDAPFAISAWSNFTGAITFKPVSGPVNVSGSTVTITGAGQAVVEADQAAVPGSFSAASQQATFQVAKAQASVMLQNLSQTYTGSPLPVTASTMPSGLGVEETSFASDILDTQSFSISVPSAVAAVSEPSALLLCFTGTMSSVAFGLIKCRRLNLTEKAFAHRKNANWPDLHISR